MYKKTPQATCKNVTKELIPEDITNAERFWILHARKSMHEDLKRGGYKRLCPRRRDDGIYVVGGRGQRWMDRATTNMNSSCYPTNTASQDSMQNTYTEGDTLECYQRPVKFDQDSG